MEQKCIKCRAVIDYAVTTGPPGWLQFNEKIVDTHLVMLSFIDQTINELGSQSSARIYGLYMAETERRLAAI